MNIPHTIRVQPKIALPPHPALLAKCTIVLKGSKHTRPAPPPAHTTHLYTRKTNNSSHPQYSERAVLACQHRAQLRIRGVRGKAEEVVDLVRAEVVVCVLAVNIMVVDVAPTHQEVGIIHPARI